MPQTTLQISALDVKHFFENLFFQCALEVGNTVIYYIDNNFNVYQTEEVVINKVNPKIIAKYTKVGDTYSIPAFNI